MKRIALIGLGVIGIPMAHKLYMHNPDGFVVIASGSRREKLESSPFVVNGDCLNSRVISCAEEAGGEIDLLLVCVKNYHLASALADIRRCVGQETVLLPLQNGIYSHRLLSAEFPDNPVMRGYMQGPNTEIAERVASYQNSGVLHVGSDSRPQVAQNIVDSLLAAGVEVVYEDDIRHMVWKKWMLNVAGNSVTALTGADYSDFASNASLVSLCRDAMGEFLQIAHAEGVSLSNEDVEDVIDYYLAYQGGKKTSMLVDVLKERRTENEYLAGAAVALAAEHGIEVPVINALYRLMNIKESLYLARGSAGGPSVSLR